MTTNRTNLNITGLDFDNIKSSILNYLSSQDQFKDYNFEGSGLNILIDILTYNTYYNAFYANMVANEAFLDSAKVKSSAISIAKHLNYTPRSYKAATAYVNIEFLNLSSDIQNRIKNGVGYNINKKDIISTKDSNGNTLYFNITQNYPIKYTNNSFFALNVETKEGSYKNVSYVVNNSDESIKYIIPETNVDIDTIEVRIQNSLNDTSGSLDIWTEVQDLNKLNSNSKVYFIQMNENNYEIYFGDNILGKQPDDGNVITISYLITSGSSANGLGKNETSLNPTFIYLNDANTKVSLVKDSSGKITTTFGGSEPESISSIKYYAPRSYQAQQRAVTANDYRVLLAQEYGDQAESVYVWGGEDNDPPIYGKVFVSIKPLNTTAFTQTQKLSIAKNILKEKNLISIIPEIVDPDYLYILITSSVIYDSAKTTMDSATFSNYIRNYIILYGRNELEKFDRSFRFSKFTKNIDSSNDSIISNTTSILLQKRIEPTINRSSSYNINFDNELYHPIDGYSSILSSSGFGYYDSSVSSNVDAYFDDDGYGNIRIYKIVGNTKIYLNNQAGTINYLTGKVTITSFSPKYFIPTTNTEIKITVIPVQQDVYSRRNLILLIDEDNINVNCIPETVRYDPYDASASGFPYNTGT